MSFLTGSRAYGTPREDSDWDIVCLVSEDALDTLMCLTGTRVEGVQSGVSIKEGCLNLIVMSDARAYAIWEAATDKLKTIAPVSRAIAKAHIIAALEDAGYPPPIYVKAEGAPKRVPSHRYPPEWY